MKADTVTKDYISDTTVFADIFNYYIYHGAQVITPELLKERDTVKVALPYGVDGAVVPIQRYRDKQNLCSVMTDGKVEYVLLGAEAQAKVQYAMPVKNSLYDALDYAGQVEKAARSHREAMRQSQEEKKEGAKGQEEEEKTMASMKGRGRKGGKTSGVAWKKPDPGEFLSGFWREDRLIPSLTVTVYFGNEEWDGPLSLFEMLEVPDPRILPYLDNYRVHLVAPARMPDEEIMKLQSSLREVFLFIKYSKDREGLNQILQQNQKRFRGLERRAVDVIEVVTKMGLEYGEEEDEVDMCEAIAQMRAEERRLGREQGREEERREMCEAIAQMRAEERRLGREEERREMSGAIAQIQEEEHRLGREEGEQNEREKIALKLLGSGKFSEKEILDYTSLTPEHLERLVNAQGNGGKE